VGVARGGTTVVTTGMVGRMPVAVGCTEVEVGAWEAPGVGVDAFCDLVDVGA